jgi:hypothetical protein
MKIFDFAGEESEGELECVRIAGSASSHTRGRREREEDDDEEEEVHVRWYVGICAWGRLTGDVEKLWPPWNLAITHIVHVSSLRAEGGGHHRETVARAALGGENLDKQPNFCSQQNMVLTYLHEWQFFCFCVWAEFEHLIPLSIV